MHLSGAQPAVWWVNNPHQSDTSFPGSVHPLGRGVFTAAVADRRFLIGLNIFSEITSAAFEQRIHRPYVAGRHARLILWRWGWASVAQKLARSVEMRLPEFVQESVYLLHRVP